ncbi:DUF3817 domain-containing protein [Corynebacterium sp. H128]|uniref:DUF3817 domain-containing protein n=1 Tax=unclassified Corynebacterium TaxID=2624378 RepID=UPI0030B4F2E1
MSPQKLYASLATAEMLTWALLLGGMALKYSGLTALGVRIAGPIHGFTFLCFGAVTILLWINNRWPARRGITGLLSTLIPFCTVPFEHSVKKAGLIDAPWRFRDTNEKPQGFFEKILAMIVRRPLLAAVLILLLIAILFTILLALGSPLEALRN